MTDHDATPCPSPLDLTDLGPEALRAIDLLVQVLRAGNTKHRPEGATAHTADDYREKAVRHIERGIGGELDPETGLPHLAHAAADWLLCIVAEESSDG